MRTARDVLADRPLSRLAALKTAFSILIPATKGACSSAGIYAEVAFGTISGTSPSSGALPHHTVYTYRLRSGVLRAAATLVDARGARVAQRFCHAQTQAVGNQVHGNDVHNTRLAWEKDTFPGHRPAGWRRSLSHPRSSPQPAPAGSFPPLKDARWSVSGLSSGAESPALPATW